MVTNQWIGLLLFFAVMYLMFWFTFTCAAPMTDGIEWLFGWIQGLIERFWSSDALPVFRSLLIDGVIHGVGGVILRAALTIFLSETLGNIRARIAFL